MVTDLSTPLVSVIMPAYNAAIYIREAITSVIAQTYTNWELIVIDDGSTDSTAAIVKQLQVTDKRINYQYQTNLGLGAARNAAFKQAQGGWLAFLDADDTWQPEKLFLQMQAAAENDNVDVIFSQGDYLYQHTAATKPYQSLIGLYQAHDMYGTLIMHNAIPALSVCFKKVWLDRAGIHKTVSIIKGCEDWDQWLRIAKTGATFLGMPNHLFKYRVHNDAMSANRQTMQLAGAYVVAYNYHPALLNATQKLQLKKQLVAVLPLLLKSLVKAKGIQQISNYNKLLIKIISIAGSQIPGFIIHKITDSKKQFAGS